MIIGSDSTPPQGQLALPTPLRNTLQVSRPGLWATQLWFYLLPLGGQRLFGEWTFWLGAVYVMFPLGYLLYGWNDWADYETDKLNPRKGNLLFGARLGRDELRRLPLRIALVQAPFWAAFVWVIGWPFLLWAAACLGVNAAYNSLGFKGRPVLDVLNQSGYLLVFVLSSWVNGLPQLGWPAMLFGALFAMHAHLANEIADVEPDRAAGRRTTAVVLGVTGTKLVIAALLIVEAVLMATFFDSALVVIFLAGAGVAFAADAAVNRGRVMPEWQLRWLLIAWNGVAVASMYWVWSEALFVR